MGLLRQARIGSGSAARALAPWLVVVAGWHACSAGVVGLELRTDASWDQDAGLLLGQDVHVVRLYGVFDGPAGPNDENVVLAVLDADLTSIIPAASLYQDPQGDDTAPDSGDFGIFPTLKWDSYVSIGRLDSAAGDTTLPLPDFSFGISDVQGAWINSFPPNLQGAPDPDFSVFLSQLSFVDVPPDIETAWGPDLILYSPLMTGTLTISHDALGGPVNTPIEIREFLDCNQNGSPDELDIAGGTSLDADLNGIPDECEACICGDINDDGIVDLVDFSGFILCLGFSEPQLSCDQHRFDCSDLNVDGTVGLADFLTFASLFNTNPTSTPPDCDPPSEP